MCGMAFKEKSSLKNLEYLATNNDFAVYSRLWSAVHKKMFVESVKVKILYDFNLSIKLLCRSTSLKQAVGSLEAQKPPRTSNN